jgi:hypothetical protein
MLQRVLKVKLVDRNVLAMQLYSEYSNTKFQGELRKAG